MARNPMLQKLLGSLAEVEDISEKTVTCRTNRGTMIVLSNKLSLLEKWSQVKSLVDSEGRIEPIRFHRAVPVQTQFNLGL